MRSRLSGGLLLTAVLSVGVVTVGCGGGGDHLTKAQFDTQGDAICKKGNQEINKAAKQVFSNQTAPSKAQFEKFANDTLIPNVQSQIDQLNDLNPPSGDEDQVKAITDEAQAALDKAKKDPTLLENNKNDPFKKANQLAKQYGLTVCGSG
jgi:hypothetical protein